MKKLFLYSAFLLALVACNNATKSSDNKSETTSDSAIVIEKDNLIIPERIYATNTAIPIKENNVINVIDNDNSTIWKTPMGAGTDEGIMFYFKDRIEIGSIELIIADGEEFAKIKDYIIYGDGKLLENKNESNQTFVIDAEVLSLYIRMGERDDKKDAKSINEEEDGMFSDNMYQKYYPIDKCIGMSEIKFFDKEGNKINIAAPKLVNCIVTASSTLEPKQAYSPLNLIDSKKEFGWAEAADGNGESEWVMFKFSDDVTISEIKIWNGYQRSDSHYKNNTRAKDISLTDQNGKEQNLTLADSQNPQAFTFDEALTGKEFRLNVKRVFQGDKYNDLVLSEIVFYENGKPILPFNLYEEEKIAETNNISNKQLKAVINRLIKADNYSNDMDNYENASHSLIIRANNSFVYYGDSEADDGYENINTKTIIAEGGWELVEDKGNSARIRIFGKMYESSVKNDLYKGKSKNTQTNIFQDYLTITDSSIQGDNFIEKIDLLW